MGYNDTTIDEIMCPLTDDMLAADVCIVFQDISNGFIKERNMPDKYKQKENWREICKTCKWQQY